MEGEPIQADLADELSELFHVSGRCMCTSRQERGCEQRMVAVGRYKVALPDYSLILAE